MYELRNTGDLVHYLYKALFITTKSALLQAVKDGHLITWPGLTEHAINVKLPQPQLRARTYTQTGQVTLRATQVRAALPHAYAVTYQNRVTDKP
jgi:hypothetical protein